MRRQLPLIVLLSVTGASCCFGQAAAAAGEHVAVNAKVSLHDGSQLLGTPHVPALVLTTSFGRPQIPLAQIAALDFGADGVRVKFHNRDVLSGKLESDVFELKTVFKDVRLPYAQIKAVQFSRQRGAVTGFVNEPGLLLHALLDADDEDLSRFDARMETRNVQIIEGPDGNAMLLDSEDAQVVINLPFSPYRMNEGTIEFWAKLPQPDKRFGGGGGQPWFFNVELHESYPGNHFGLGFIANNGHGNGGLVGHAMGIITGTGGASSVTGSGVLGNTPDGWHHYTLIWKRDGFDFPEANGLTLLITVDGQTVASANTAEGFIPPDIEHIPDVGTRLVIHDSNSDCTRPVAMSGLKIWDYAKSPDRFETEN